MKAKKDFSSNLVRIIPGLHHWKLPQIENSFSEWNEQVHGIQQIYRPKGWNNATLKYDLAIIVLKTPIKYSWKVKAINIDMGLPNVKALRG